MVYFNITVGVVQVAQVTIGNMKVRKVGTSLVVTIPKHAAETLGLTEGSLINLIVEPLEIRPRLDPQLRAAMELALDDVEPGLHYLKG